VKRSPRSLWLCLWLLAGASASAAPPKFADELTVYAIPAPRPAELRWKTPGGLVRRVLLNEVGAKLGLMDRTLGHMGVHIQCAAGGGLPAAEWKGSMTHAVEKEFTETVIKQGYALGILFHNYSGRFERPEELQKSVDERVKNGRIAFVRFGLRPETCRRLLAYVKELDARGVNRFYGLAARPRYREGAGCSAFSMSVVEVAGLLEEAFTKSWTVNVRVPLKLVGGPITGKHISIARAALYLGPWAAPNEPNKPIFAWDPTLAFDWIRAEAQRLLAAPATADRAEKRGEAFGLVYDRRQVATPTDGFWRN
jgi:hypothetical protein